MATTSETHMSAVIRYFEMKARTARVSNSFSTHFQELDHILADFNKFEQLISQISSNEDKFRFLFTLAKESRVDSLCLGLCKLLDCEPNTHLQVTSCFNEIFNSPYFFFTSESTIEKIKDTLSHAFQNHVSDPFQNLVSKSSAILFKTVSEFYTTGKWPELLNIMFLYMKPQSVGCLQENVLMLFKNIAENGNSGRIISHLPTFRSIFSEYMRRHLNLNINIDTNMRIAAMSASVSFIEFVLTKDTVKQFQCLLPLMMNILTDGVNSESDSMAEDSLELLIKLARINPDFFEEQLGKVLRLMLKISMEDRVDIRIRHLAIEVLMSLVEKAPDMIRKETQFVKRLFQELIYWLCEIADDDGKLFEYESFFFAKDCLSRFCILLDDSIFQWILRLLSYLLCRSKWEERHAVLVAIPIISKGCFKMKQEDFEELVTMVLESCHDSHPQVKFAAINSIKELFERLDLFWKQRCQVLVALTLLDFWNDFQNYQLQERAASVVLNFSEDGTLYILAPYLERIVSGLFILLQDGWQMVPEGALITLLSVNHAYQVKLRRSGPNMFMVRLRDLVRAHYNDVMPQLRAILEDAINQSKHMLRAKAMEFILLSGLAVEEVGQIMEILLYLKRFQMELDDSLSCLMLHVWAKLFKHLRQDFLPYLSSFIPFLLQCVQLKPDISTTSSYTKRKSIWSTKDKACGMLIDFAHRFNEDFFPWISQATTTLVPLLKVFPNKGVKRAVEAVLSLLRLAGKKRQSQGPNVTYSKQLIDDIMAALMEALHEELEVEICVMMLDSLNECVQIAGPSLDKGRVRCIFDVIKQVIRGRSAGVKESAEWANAEDFDAEKGKEVLGPVGNLLGTLIKTLKASFLPFFQELTSYVTPMWSKDESAEEKLFHILIFDHVVDHCHEAALKYYDTYLPFLLEACNDKNPAVRQAAIDGVHVCAAIGGSVFKPYIPEAFARLNAVIIRPSGNDIAYEKAVATRRTICQFHGDSVDAAQESFVQWL